MVLLLQDCVGLLRLKMPISHFCPYQNMNIKKNTLNILYYDIFCIKKLKTLIIQ